MRGWWGVMLRVVAVALGFFLTWNAEAHDPGISTAQADLKPDGLVITTGFAPGDAQSLLPPASRQGDTWSAAEFDAVHDQLLALAPNLWEVRVGGTIVTPRDARVELLAGDAVSFQLTFPRDPAASRITLRALKMPELPSGHRQFVVVSDDRGSMLTKKLLKAQDFELDVTLADATAPMAASATPSSETKNETAAWEFIKLGVEHIWTGYDHLLFLFALLVVCRRFRSIVGIISCFTVAHSLTLALATLNVVTLPSRWVEAAIAASIVFVGVENLVRRGEEPRGRWALTFGFGLIHGFGFASVLRDLGVGGGARDITLPLFTFNLGVELGQIAIAAVVLPLVWQLRKHAWFVHRGVAIFSAIVAGAGLYWLLERTVL